MRFRLQPRMTTLLAIIAEARNPTIRHKRLMRSLRLLALSHQKSVQVPLAPLQSLRRIPSRARPPPGLGSLLRLLPLPGLELSVSLHPSPLTRHPRKASVNFPKHLQSLKLLMLRLTPTALARIPQSLLQLLHRRSMRWANLQEMILVCRRILRKRRSR